MNRRGISAIVSVSAVILLAIIMGFIVSKGVDTLSLSLSPALSCTEFAIKAPLSIEKTTYNENTGDLEVTVRRTLDATPLADLSFTLADSSGATHTWLCASSCRACTILEPGTTKTYRFAMSKPEHAFLSVQTGRCTLASVPLS